MSDYTPPTLVIPTPGGNPGDGSLSGELTLESTTAQYSYGGNYLSVGSEKYPILTGDGYGGVMQRCEFGGTGHWAIQNESGVIGIAFGNAANVYMFNNVDTVGLGLSPLYGKDVRTGLTAADASATTLYTTTAANQVYEVAARILGTGGTITSCVYTIGWTEGGVARTATVSITATGTLSSSLFLLQPDSGTAITGQLTTLSGTSPVVNVAAVVKEDV